MADEQNPIGHNHKVNWLTRWWRGRRLQANDRVTAQIGDNASHVVVGKNVIQIGSIQVPSYLAVMITVCVVIMIGLLVKLALDRKGTDQGVQQLIAKGNVTATPTPTATPVIMPSSTYNIAVSKLIALDTAGQPVANPEAFDRGTSIAAYLNGETAFIEQIRHATGEQPTIWGPDQHIPAIVPALAVEQAQALGANLVIYGYLRQVSVTQWKLEPSFYVASDSLSFEGNLFGEYSFSSPIQYSPTDQASIHDLTTKMENLLRTLTFLIMGISYYEHDTADTYCQAASLFQVAAGHSADEQTDLAHYCPPNFVPQANSSALNQPVAQVQEQAIANLFLGTSYLHLAFIASKDAQSFAQITKLLQMARKAYETGKALNPELARLDSGLGQVAYYEARLQQKPSAWIQEDCENLDFSKLDSARMLFSATLEQISRNQALANNTPNANLRTAAIAHLGLGRVYQLLNRCDKSTATNNFEQAQQQYAGIIDVYKRQPKFYMLKTTVYAYAELGSLLLWRAATKDLTTEESNQVEAQAKSYLKQAYALSQNSHSEVLLKDVQSNTIVCSVLDCK